MSLDEAEPAPASPPRRRWLRRLLWLLPLAGALAWWGWRQLNPPPVAPPVTAPVALADIEQIVQSAGVLQPRRRVDVGAQVSGQVRTLHVQPGQTVRRGELLVSLDPELARSEVLQAEAGVAQQQALLEARRIDLAQARRELARQQQLLGGQATARAEAEKAEADAAKLEVDARALSAQLGRLQADLATARLKLGYTQISAPVDGDVVSLAVQEGQTVNAQQQVPTLLTLAQLDVMTVKAQVAEADVRHVQVGQSASFVTLGDTTRRHSGTVRLVQPLPERVNNAVFYSVLFDVPNPRGAGGDRALMSDMSVQVRLSVGRAAQVPAIPMTALGERQADGRWRVQVLADASPGATPQDRLVRVGLNDAAQVQVLDGLKTGERVLTPPGPAQAASAASAAR